jgi:cytoskeletal protein RodZ
MAGAALFPQAAMRSAGAVRDLSDSGLIVRLTRGRGWIAVLCALLGGIVALNVLSLSLTAGSGRLSLQIDELKTQNSALRAQIDERLSAVKVEAEAARLGLANPDPKAITFLSAKDANVRRLLQLLATDSFLVAPSLPSSYPAPGTSYAPVPTDDAATATAAEPTTTAAPTTETPTDAAPSSTAPSATGAAGGGSSGSGTSTGSSTGTTGGVGL